MPRESRSKEAVTSGACYGTFPLNLRELMSEKHITQQALADAIGVTRQAVSNYMTGVSSPDWEKLAKISTFLGVSSDYLIGISDFSNPDISAQAACAYTGLSEQVIEKLRVLAASKRVVVNHDFPYDLKTEPVPVSNLLFDLLSAKSFKLLLSLFVPLQNKTVVGTDALNGSENIISAQYDLDNYYYKLHRAFDSLLEELFHAPSTLVKLDSAVAEYASQEVKTTVASTSEPQDDV